jgi:hypothetical protein
MSVANSHLVVITKFVAARENNPRAALFALKATAAELLPGNRIGICYHHRLPDVETVNLWYTPEGKKAYYRGLMKCGQGWLCPVCAQKLSEIRRKALRTAIDNTRETYLPIMVTYTVQHHKGQPLSELLQGMNSAYRRMRMQRLWRMLKEEYLIVGETRAIEITHNENGWHPHFHVVVWMDLSILDAIRAEDGSFDLPWLAASMAEHFTPIWIESLAKFGLSANKGPGLKVSTTDDLLNDYITKGGVVLPADDKKWSMAEEMTKGAQKKAHRDGKTAWDLLLEYFAGMAESGALFQEYAVATKGKSALQFTPGLKDKLGLILDEESELIAEEIARDEILLAQIDITLWRKIVETQAIGELLDVASKGDTELLERAIVVIERRFERKVVYIQ